MRAYVTLMVSALILFSMAPVAVAGCDEGVADADLNIIAGGMTETQVAELIRRAQESAEQDRQVATRR